MANVVLTRLINNVNQAESPQQRPITPIQAQYPAGAGGSGGGSSTDNLASMGKSLMSYIAKKGAQKAFAGSADALAGDAPLAAAPSAAPTSLASFAAPAETAATGAGLGAGAGTLASAWGEGGLAAAGDAAASNMVAGMGANVAPSIATDGAAQAGGLASGAWALPAAAFAGLAYKSGLLHAIGIGADPDRVPVGNPLTGKTILEGQPGYKAVSDFLAPGAAASTASLNTSPMDAMALYGQYQSGNAPKNPFNLPPQKSYLDLYKEYVSQGGNPNDVLPQYRNMTGG